MTPDPFIQGVAVGAGITFLMAVLIVAGFLFGLGADE